MEKKFKDFSQEDITRLLNTPAGKQLASLLARQDPALLQKAAQQARSGNSQQAKQTLQQVLSSPEVAQLLRQLGGKEHG